MKNIVLSEATIKKYKKKFRNTTLMDDMKFRKVCESKEAIQEILKIILIMFCEFDIFSIRKPIYEIDRIVRGTKIKADDGVREIYVNLKAKATDKKLKSLFKIMTTIKEVDDKTFPTLSRKKKEINDMYIGGDRNMAGLDLMMYKDGLREGREEGRAEGREEGRVEGRAEGVQQGMEQGEISAIVKLYKNGLIKIEDAIKMLNISNEKFLQLIK